MPVKRPIKTCQTGAAVTGYGLIRYGNLTRALAYVKQWGTDRLGGRQSPFSQVGALLALVFLLGAPSVQLNEGRVDSGQRDVNSAGEQIMTGDELTGALRRLDSHDRAGIDRLASAVMEQVRSPLRSVVELALSSDKDLSGKARSLLSEVDDLAIVPLLDTAEPDDPFLRVWQMNTLMSAHLELRDKVVVKLDLMLADKTSIPWRTIEPFEGLPKPSRVCDEAYLVMRRLLNAREEKMQFLRESEAFLSLSDKEKDAEILKAKKSRVWTNLLGEED